MEPLSTVRPRPPLVSCVMPTYGRRRFLPQALRCFANRTYRHAELIVVDDSERGSPGVCEGVQDVRYLRVPRMSTGAKLNLGIEAARGEILHKIDDDDYYAPDFLATSVRHLLGQDPAHTLVTRCCFLVMLGGEGGVLRHSGHGWMAGGGLCFYRDLWRRTPFRDLYGSSDTYFRRDLDPTVIQICQAGQYFLVRHGANTWNDVRSKRSGETLDADEYLRQLPRYEKTAAELLDAKSLAFYRRILGWRHTPQKGSLD